MIFNEYKISWVFENTGKSVFFKKIKFIFVKNYFFILNRFDTLILKNKKNIILMHFGMKNTLKNNHNHTLKQA